jgi:adenine-specific DNA methylase
MAESLFGGRRRSPDEESPGDSKGLFTAQLSRVFLECRRVLRANGSMILTFHHRAPDAWESLGQALHLAGFTVLDVVPVRSEGRSGIHSYDGTIKYDSILFCKPARLAKARRSVEKLVSEARTMTTAWAKRFQRAGLRFSPVDRYSIALSMVLRAHSRTAGDLSLLRSALDRILPP